MPPARNVQFATSATFVWPDRQRCYDLFIDPGERHRSIISCSVAVACLSSGTKHFPLRPPSAFQQQTLADCKCFNRPRCNILQILLWRFLLLLRRDQVHCLSSPQDALAIPTSKAKETRRRRRRRKKVTHKAAFVCSVLPNFQIHNRTKRRHLTFSLQRVPNIVIDVPRIRAQRWPQSVARSKGKHGNATNPRNPLDTYIT